MSDDINVNKITDKHKRRAEHIEDRLEKQGMGRDHAKKEALHRAVDELGYSAGGPHAAGESAKHANHERDTGSAATKSPTPANPEPGEDRGGPTRKSPPRRHSRPHPHITKLSRHDFRKRLSTGEVETLEILGREFQPGAGAHFSDDRTGDWTTHPKDVTVISHSRIVVERATHRDVPSDAPGPVAATLRVIVTCPYLPPVTHDATIEFLD